MQEHPLSKPKDIVQFIEPQPIIHDKKSEKLAIFDIERELFDVVAYFLGLSTEEIEEYKKRMYRINHVSNKEATSGGKSVKRFKEDEKAKLVVEIQEKLARGLKVKAPDEVQNIAKMDLVFYEDKYTYIADDVMEQLQEVLSKFFDPESYESKEPKRFIRLQEEGIIEFHMPGCVIIFSKFGVEDPVILEVRTSAESGLKLGFQYLTTECWPQHHKPTRERSIITLESRDFFQDVPVNNKLLDDSRLINYPEFMSSSCDYYGNGSISTFRLQFPGEKEYGRPTLGEGFRFDIDPYTNNLHLVENYEDVEERFSRYVKRGLEVKIENDHLLIRCPLRGIYLEHRYPLVLDYKQFPGKITEHLKQEFGFNELEDRKEEIKTPTEIVK